MEKIKVIKKAEQVFFVILIAVFAICCILNYMGIVDYDIDLEGLIVVGVISLICILWIWFMAETRAENIILFIGYAIRILLLFIDVYGRKYIVLFSSGADSEGFWRNALSRYQGDVVREYTKYPYIIQSLLNIFGENRLLAQYANILFWLFAMLLLYQCFAMLNIRGNTRLFGICCITFMPQYMILTAILMRESMIVFLNLASCYFFLKWYEKEKFVNLILAGLMVLLSMVLHSGAIALGMAYGMFYAFYDSKKKRIRISGKSFIILTAGITFIFLIYFTPLQGVFLAYIPKIDNILDIQNRYFQSGGSDYLRNMHAENLRELFLFTIIRILYFFFSPVPWEWRGLQDIAAFSIDALFQLLVFVTGIMMWIKKKEKRRLIGIFLLCCIFSGVIFSWGVSNAGTAMRHRNKLIGLEVLLVCFSLNKKEKNAGREKNSYGENNL